MEWTQQLEDMMRTWTESQQKAWDSFFETVQSAGQTPTTKSWLQTLSMGEEMLKGILTAQVDGLAAWVGNLGNLPDMPSAAVESAGQFLEMTRRWNKTQTELVENWFGMVRKLVPTLPGESAVTDAPQSMFRAWQATTHSIMEAQTEWMRAWMSAATKK